MISTQPALGTLRPLVNGEVLVSAVSELEGDASRFRLRITHPSLGVGAFVIDRELDGDRVWLEYGLEGVDLEVDSFGLRFDGLTGIRSFLRHGYYSWDGGELIDVAKAPDEVRGFAMTVLLPEEGAGGVVLGVDRHDRFQHTFTLRGRRQARCRDPVGPQGRTVPLRASHRLPPLQRRGRSARLGQGGPRRCTHAAAHGRAADQRLVLLVQPLRRDHRGEPARAAAGARPR